MVCMFVETFVFSSLFFCSNRIFYIFVVQLQTQKRITMKKEEQLVRFDWAMKRLLRNKANFVVLEGFLSTLLKENIHITKLLESESNKEDENDKFNRVDLLAQNDKDELFIIEIQNSRELDYFHRILYGTSKTITEYIHEGEQYGVIRKVYSINIIYFGIGIGMDYVYHGKTVFRGIHHNDILQLTARQQAQFRGKEAGDIFPEYYILRVDDFDQLATTPLDEWISFLKTGTISADATAQGLPEARECLRIMNLTDAERRAYYHHMDAVRYQKSVIQTGWIEGHDDGYKEGREEGLEQGHVKGLKEGLEQGRAEGLEQGRAEGLAEGEKKAKIEIALQLKEQGLPVEAIVTCTGLSIEEIQML